MCKLVLSKACRQLSHVMCKLVPRIVCKKLRKECRKWSRLMCKLGCWMACRMLHRECRKGSRNRSLRFGAWMLQD